VKLSAEDVRPLPVRQAFVVQVSVEADVKQGHWIGRVEHVVSGEATHFQTLDALLEFMTQVLVSESPPPPAKLGVMVDQGDTRVGSQSPSYPSQTA
jgi:hypothetical protein